MIDLDLTFFFQLANFIGTLIVLNFLLIKPIRTIVKQRAGVVSGLLGDVDAFTKDAEGKLKNYEAALSEARIAGTNERLKLKSEATAEEKKLLDAATKQAQERLVAARAETAGQVKAAFEQLKASVGAMADKAAAKVLG